MTSLGQVLKTAREEKKLTFADIHTFIKIHPRYLQALEEGDYSVFENSIHAKGFLRNYADFLELNVEKIMAIWRREYGTFFTSKDQNSKKYTPKNIETPKFQLSLAFLGSVAVGVLVIAFFSYLIYQYRTYSDEPNLEIYSPKPAEVVTDSILDITGKTDIDSVLFINNQRVVLNTDGSFATSIKLNQGINSIGVVSINKLGKEVEKVLSVIYRPTEVAGDSSVNTPNIDSESLEEAVESTQSSLSEVD